MAISELHIAWPWVFFLLLPLAAGWWAFSRSPFHVSDEPSLRLSNVEGLNQEDYGKKAISPFFLLALLLVLVALSRPQIQGPDNVSRLSFMLVLDVSGSMQQPYRVKEGIQSKLDWIKRAVQRFLTELSRRPPAFIPEVGIVLFADHAYRMFPPTRDLDHLAAAVKAIETGMIGEKSSLDEAIVLSLGEVRGRSDNATSQGGEGKSGVLVIMTDGLHTSERLRLKQALTSAVKQQVAVFPIVIGSTSVNDSEVGFFTQLADETGGKVSHFEGDDSLLAIWNEIFERTPVNGSGHTWREVYQWPLVMALFIFLCHGLLSYKRSG